jgi:cysteine desulfurase
VLFHTDAVQAAGKIPIELRAAPINFCSLSAHKLHGPKGVGALYVSGRSAFRPLLFGGVQEEGRRAGTENVASIVGFGKAAERAAESLPQQQPRVRAMRDRFEATLLADLPETHVNGDRTARLPNTSSLSFAGVDSEAALLLLDRAGVCCSAGSACRAGSTETSHVLRAMHLPDERIRGALRFSFGRFNTDTDVDAAVTRVSAAIRKLRAMAPAPPL